MSANLFYRLDHISVVDVSGADALIIAHNLTTNAVQTLPQNGGCETFLTDVRGKTIGHVFFFRVGDSLRLIGSAGQSERIADQFERYTIREDAHASVCDHQFVAIVLGEESAKATAINWEPSDQLQSCTMSVGGIDVDAFQTRWLGASTTVLLATTEQSETVCVWLESQGLVRAGEDEFQMARTLANFPWFGIDLNDSNLPQEADRDRLAISFTKGCYLGQETVARLDALGQVQKKLVRWKISTPAPPAGATLSADGKTVGRLTSIAQDPSLGMVAIGFARRSHFDAGATASGIDDETGHKFTGTVL